MLSDLKPFALAALIAIAGVPGCFSYAKPLIQVADSPDVGKFPHDLFTKAIEGHVSDGGLIDYKAILAERAKLDQYLAYVAAVSPESNPSLFPTRQDKLAYYINAYNALAIRGVIERPGLKSVDDIKTDFFFFTRYNLGGRKIDLYTLEYKIVRPTFKDPRVHFALNCQSLGCPTFPKIAFPAAGLDAFLDEQTRRFVNNPHKVRKKEDGGWEVSEIFEWFAVDFEDAGGAAAFIHQFRDEVPADATVTYIPYDWKLIAQEGKGP